jgi:hypothetical protein
MPLTASIIDHIGSRDRFPVRYSVVASPLHEHFPIDATQDSDSCFTAMGTDLEWATMATLCQGTGISIESPSVRWDIVRGMTSAHPDGPLPGTRRHHNHKYARP